MQPCWFCGLTGQHAPRCPAFMLKASTPGPDVCIECGRELCKALDAYYGRDMLQAMRCSKCRK